MALATAPAAGAHDHQKYINTTTQYERQIAYLRELLTHTFLRAVYHTSSRQARLEYKEIQEAFLNKNATRPVNQVKKFTAQNIIDYILDNCVTDNDKSLTQITNAFNDMIRYKGQTLLNWLQSFAPLMTRYRKAYGTANTLQPAEIKKLWKLHFAKQINMNEQQLMLNFKKDHLSQTELGKISALTDGVFDVAVMTKLLTKIGASLVYYEPDAMVKSYLYQYSHSLGWNRDKLPSETPRKRIPVIKGIPKVLKGSPLITQETPVTSDKSTTQPRFVLGTYVGEKCVDRKART
jgi:hypothetical protein